MHALVFEPEFQNVRSYIGLKVVSFNETDSHSDKQQAVEVAQMSDDKTRNISNFFLPKFEFPCPFFDISQKLLKILQAAFAAFFYCKELSKCGIGSVGQIYSNFGREFYFKRIYSSAVIIIQLMLQKSAIVFFTRPISGNSGHYYTHSDLGVRTTHETASYSVLVSLAEFLVWKFPNLVCPGKETKQLTQVPTTTTFPNELCGLHDMYQHWCDLLCEAVETGNALREKETCYYGVEVSESYGSLLEQQGFKKINFQGEWNWGVVGVELQQALQSTEGQQNGVILFVNCSEIEFRPVYYGLFFNNENWRYFRVLKEEYPTASDYSDARAVMVPGSPLHISQQVPQLKKFSTQLATALDNNRSLRYLGICFGAQLIAHVMGGHVAYSGKTHNGVETLNILKRKQPLPNTLAYAKQLLTHSEFKVYQDHSDQIKVLPPNFEILSSSQDTQKEIVASTCGRILGIQGHPQMSAGRIKLNKIRKHYQANKNAQEVMKLVVEPVQEYDNPAVIRRMICRFLRC